MAILRKNGVGILGFVSAAILFVPFFVFGQLPGATPGLLVADRRAQLELDLANIEKEIEAQRVVLEGKQRERVSLERDVAILNAKIDKARLSIRARNLAIERLRGDIGGKEATIDSLLLKLGREKDSLAQLIRKTNEIDSYSFAEIVLSNQNLSDFFIDLDSFASIKEALNTSFQVINSTRETTENEKEVLESKVNEELELRKIQELEAKDIGRQEAEKQRILKESRGQEAVYQQVIKDKEKTAAQIRTELFSLRDSAAIPFEKAYQYAVSAGGRTGVRPAFILAIIAYESKLGEDVGTGSWRSEMHPTRDVPIFAQLAAKLGLNPDSLPVSLRPCSKAERDRVGPGKPCGYGYGGAMGPAQFIPSTWVLYEERISAATGHNPPNPWNADDAFMASAILLMDNGADNGTRAAEHLAARRYLAGWNNANKSSAHYYGDNVMELVDKYQQQIDILQRES